VEVLAPGERDLDLGTLYVRPMRTAGVLVRDEEGATVADAAVAGRRGSEADGFARTDIFTRAFTEDRPLSFIRSYE